MIRSQKGAFIGDMVFAFDGAEDVHIADFSIESGFDRKGLGTAVMAELFIVFRRRGIRTLTGICKSYRRKPADKENLAKWYESLGFILTREISPDPGYLGKLKKTL